MQTTQEAMAELTAMAVYQANILAAQQRHAMSTGTSAASTIEKKAVKKPAAPRRASAKIFTELCHVPAFHGLPALYAEDSMQLAMHHTYMESAFWGTGNIASSLDTLMKGEGPFAFLYEEIAMLEGGEYFLKHDIAGSDYVVRDNRFSADILQCSAYTKPKNVKVQGHTL